MNKETIYFLQNTNMLINTSDTNIRWLTESDLGIFNEHLILCGQKQVSSETWQKIIDEQTQYCCLFLDKKPIVRAAVERLSNFAWEYADVKVVKELRSKGYGKKIVSFVSWFILSQSKTTTCRTTDDNIAMQKVMLSLGYKKVQDILDVSL